MSNVELGTLSAVLGSSERVQADPFAVASDVAAICAERNYDHVAQEIVLRALNKLECFGDCRRVIEALVRQCGLFPYLDPGNAATDDLFAIGLHRLGKLGPDFVLHSEQRAILSTLLGGRSVVLSAPTSFGKSVLIDAMLAEGGYSNVLILVPTIALMDEARRRLSVRFSPGFKVITHLSQEKGSRNIFVLTPERANLERIGELDLFIVDEFYKLGIVEDVGRHATLNKLCYRLLKTGKQFFMLGPNIEGIPDQMRERCQFLQSEFRTVAANVSVLGAEDPLEETIRLCKQLGDSTIVFCRSPGRVIDVSRRMIEAGLSWPNSRVKQASEWAGVQFHPDWHFARAVAHGIGIHHGAIPRSLAHWCVKAFNDGSLSLLLCTTTLIEGVNTRAENMIILDSKVMRRPIDFFTFNNIKGRAGRMMKHFVGNVFMFSDAPQIELPFVDFQFYTQPDGTSPEILLELDDEDLTPASRDKVTPFHQSALVNWETLRQNGLDPLQQIAAARQIDASPEFWARQFEFTTFPTYAQVEAICRLMWECFSGGKIAQGAVRSPEQLANLVFNLRNRTLKDLIANFIPYSEGPDDAVQRTSAFIRNWAMFHFPRLLIGLGNIARDVLSRYRLTAGDVSPYAQQVENLFHDAGVAALDEYGVPLPLAFRLERRLAYDNSLDGTLALLQQLDLDRVPLVPFERELLEDAKQGLR